MSDQLFEMMNQIPMKNNKSKDNMLINTGKNFKSITRDKNSKII